MLLVKIQTFLLGIYLEMEFLSYRLYLCTAVVDTNKCFSKSGLPSHKQYMSYCTFASLTFFFVLGTVVNLHFPNDY